MSDFVPLPVADELAIRSMFARYVHYLDGGDARGWSDLFTDDASWTRLNSPPRELGGSGLAAETIRDARISTRWRSTWCRSASTCCAATR